MDGRRPAHATFPTRDHVIPKARGGRWTVRVCRRCNGDKKDLPLTGWLALLQWRGDPRAEHVEAFIAKHPWTVPYLASAPPPGEHIAVPPGRIDYIAEPEPGVVRRWRCLDCGSRHHAREDAQHHWRDVHGWGAGAGA